MPAFRRAIRDPCRKATSASTSHGSRTVPHASVELAGVAGSGGSADVSTTSAHRDCTAGLASLCKHGSHPTLVVSQILHTRVTGQSPHPRW